MKPVISIILGAPMFFFLVFNPLKSKLMTSFAMTTLTDAQSKIMTLTLAHTVDPLSIKILEQLGDICVANGAYPTALWAYGQAIILSPADGLLRIKYGESLLGYGFNGLFAIKEALTLEPNNPVFLSEVNRVTRLQLPWP